MSHLFEVGGKYRNRDGEYEVVAIDGNHMVIRYLQGGTIQTTVTMQERIWSNMQIETTSEEEKPKAKPPKAKPRRVMGRDFQGLVESDFKDNVTDTSWRRKENLGGLLAQQLTEAAQRDPATGDEFNSWTIYRRSEVHIARPKHYDPKQKQRQAKFLFMLNSESARYGFYIEHSREPMDETWDWHRFLDCVENDAEVQQKIEHTMRKLGLRWEVWDWETDEVGFIALTAEVENGAITLRGSLLDGEEPMPFEWTRFATLLRELKPNSGWDVHLCKYVDKDAAINMGTRIAAVALDTFEATLPLYEGSVSEV